MRTTFIKVHSKNWHYSITRDPKALTNMPEGIIPRGHNTPRLGESTVLLP
jgi:hypothetical protein